ncbi:MAG: DUF1684 domain-containing protein [Anaerolineales bacterium]|nr:DUF1684 domain-containing protein [Anaerolineales bacterium]
MTAQDYFDEIKEYQRQLDEQLRAPDGWLTLVGLHWLNEGKNTVGAALTCDIPLPEGTGPGLVGTIVKTENTVTFMPYPGVEVKIGEQIIKSETELESDINQNPTILSIGEVSIYLVIRNSRFGIRVKYETSPNRVNFEGRVWWPIDIEKRVTAAIEYYDPQKMVDVPDVLGNVNKTAMDCALKFQVGGLEYSLDAFGLPSGQFYILFQDLSCQNGSYPAGRFLVTEYPEDEAVVIDFNKAHNPPCAFTSFATCPLPPEQNHLDIEIKAGERYKPLLGLH